MGVTGDTLRSRGGEGGVIGTRAADGEWRHELCKPFRTVAVPQPWRKPCRALLIALSLGLSFTLLAGHAAGTLNARDVGAWEEEGGVHVNSPGVNVDAKKNETEKDKRVDVNVDVKK